MKTTCIKPRPIVSLEVLPIEVPADSCDYIPDPVLYESPLVSSFPTDFGAMHFPAIRRGIVKGFEFTGKVQGSGYVTSRQIALLMLKDTTYRNDLKMLERSLLEQGKAFSCHQLVEIVRARPGMFPGGGKVELLIQGNFQTLYWISVCRNGRGFEFFTFKFPDRFRGRKYACGPKKRRDDRDYINHIPQVYLYRETLN